MVIEAKFSGGISTDDGSEFDSEVFETDFYEWLESKGYKFSGFVRAFTQAELDGDE